MTTKDKVQKFVKDNKGKIIAGACVIGGAIIGAIGMKAYENRGTLPYKTVVGSDDKEFITGVTEMFNWGGGKPFDGARIGWGLTDTQVREGVDSLVGEDSGDYLYSMMIERIKKDKL